MALTQEQFDKRLKELLAEEITQPEGYWYISFAGQQGFAGGFIGKGHGFVSVRNYASKLGINPRDVQSMGMPIPPDKVPPLKYHDRLLNKDELRECWADMKTLGEIEGEDADNL